MGFISMLFLIPAFAIGIYSMIRLLVLFFRKQLTSKIIIQGILLSVMLQILVFCSFLLCKTYYIFLPMFRQIFVLTILPFILYIPLECLNIPITKKLTKIILICIFFSVISAGFLMFHYDSLLNFFGVKGHY